MPYILQFVNSFEEVDMKDRVIYAITAEDIMARYEDLRENSDYALSSWDELSNEVRDSVFNGISNDLIGCDTMMMSIDEVVTENIIALLEDNV